MASPPSKLDAARYILQLFVEKFNCRPGHVLRVNNFQAAFFDHPWKASDFADGMNYAGENGWVEILRGASSFKLTDSGYAKAGDRKVDLEEDCNELITIENKDGARHEDVRSLVTSDTALIPYGNLPISLGDAILRKLPSGLVERLIVTDLGFYAESEVAEAHYQVKYEL